MDRRGFLVGAALLPVLGRAAGQDFDSFRQSRQRALRDQRQDFDAYRQELAKAFAAFQREHERALAAFRDRARQVWKHPELTSARKWAEYRDGFSVQRVVDFGGNEVRIKLARSAGGDAERRARAELADLLQEDFGTVFRRDPVARQVEGALEGEQVERSRPGQRPVLAELFPGGDPSPGDARRKARELLQGASTSRESLTESGGEGERWAAVISVPLPEDRPLRKARELLPAVREQARKWEVASSLVLAVAHTESAFNPMARSHVPAFGLMQIVPGSGGRDASRELFGRPRVLAPSYLYDPGNNIEIGTVYLHLLYHRYMKAVADPESRLYCAISAYNTGPGNVARVFGDGGDVGAAARAINRRSGGEVYRALREELPYPETRHYLRRVTRRMRAYKEL